MHQKWGMMFCKTVRVYSGLWFQRRPHKLRYSGPESASVASAWSSASAESDSNFADNFPDVVKSHARRKRGNLTTSKTSIPILTRTNGSFTLAISQCDWDDLRFHKFFDLPLMTPNHFIGIDLQNVHSMVNAILKK